VQKPLNVDEICSFVEAAGEIEESRSSFSAKVGVLVGPSSLRAAAEAAQLRSLPTTLATQRAAQPK
jgi:hypothetical protein